MDVPGCVRNCSHHDLKAAAEIAFTRGSIQDRNDAARNCLLFNKRLNQSTILSQDNRENELKKYMEFVDLILFEKL